MTAMTNHRFQCSSCGWYSEPSPTLLECEKCKSVFEAMQSVSAKPLKTCNQSSCKGKVHRLVSASGFIFKGGGW